MHDLRGVAAHGGRSADDETRGMAASTPLTFARRSPRAAACCAASPRRCSRKCWLRARPARWTSCCAGDPGVTAVLRGASGRCCRPAGDALADDPAAARRAAAALGHLAQLRPDGGRGARRHRTRGLARSHELAALAGAGLPLRLRCRCPISATATAAAPTNRRSTTCAACGRSGQHLLPLPRQGQARVVDAAARAADCRASARRAARRGAAADVERGSASDRAPSPGLACATGAARAERHARRARRAVAPAARRRRAGFIGVLQRFRVELASHAETDALLDASSPPDIDWRATFRPAAGAGRVRGGYVATRHANCRAYEQALCTCANAANDKLAAGHRLRRARQVQRAARHRPRLRVLPGQRRVPAPGRLA